MNETHIEIETVCGQRYVIEDFPTALKKLEGVIDKGLAQAADAFQQIKKFKLYRIDYPGKTFEEYCEIRWGKSHRAINYLIMGRKVALENGNLSSQISVTALGRHVARLPKKAQKEVIEQLTANGNQPTVEEVKEAVDERLNIKRRKPAVPAELKEELEKSGVCPLCGHHRI